MTTNQILSALAWAFCWGILILGGTYAQAQTVVATKCYTPPANTASFDNNMGAVVGGVNFVSGVDIPAGYKIADMEIQITWSKTLGTCASPTAGTVDVSEVGFGLQDPTGATIYFAPSNSFAALLPMPSGTFSGTGQVLNLTTTFKASQLSNPATFPMVAAAGTYRFNNTQTLPSIVGTSPFGGIGWSLVAIDDAPASTGVLCIQSYCIKIYACPGSPVDAVCKTGTINLPLSPNGIRNLTFADLDNGSDTSCLLKSVVFTPNSVNCTAVGQPASVVKMVLTDALGGRDSCTATVSVVDTTRPIAICRNITVPLTNAGTAVVQPTAINNGSSDECSITAMTINGMLTQTYNCANVGATTATLRIMDMSGNTSVCSAIITVMDITPPVVVCKNISVCLNQAGNVTVPASAISDISNDNCGISIYRINGQPSAFYNATNIGQNPANLTVMDIYGNQSSCLATISVVAANSINCTVFSNSNVVGNVYYDHNNNCTQNLGIDSAAHSGILVRATNTQNPNQIYTAYTQPNGGYEFSLPLGEYRIQAQPNQSGYYAACTPSYITVSSLSTVIVQHLGIQLLRLCPLLKVEVDANLLRRCNTSSYNISYENIGTQTANNAYIEVTFDPFLTYISNNANISATHLGNNKYRFPVGNLGIYQQRNFQAVVSVSCDATLGQVHCTEAHIYPDSVCGLNWNGPIIQILDTCMRDSVVFRLVNLGTNMLANQTYSVVEDNLIYRPDMAFQLPAGGSLNVSIPTRPNRTYRIEVRQAPNYPALLGDSLAWAIVQNCNGISNTTASNPNIFNTQNVALAISTDCTPNVASYDPNQKTAQQIGYGSQHFINANTSLEYKIEFQNTGTDTAFRVVILDTLDTNVLDPASIQIGTSSHAFTWALLQNNILKFTFDNIQLVDSFTNEPLSRGYVSFHIAQQLNLATNTVINNKASIYFDANAPIITNTCTHTVGANFVQRLAVTVGETLNPTISVKAYPNPFQNFATIEIIGAENQMLTLRIIDAMGKTVQTQASQQPTLQISRENLPAGVYFYQLFGNGQLLNTGKLIAE